MYDYISGNIVELNPAFVVVDNHGIDIRVEANTPVKAVFQGELNQWKDEDASKTWTVLLDRKPWHWYMPPNYYHVQHTSFGSIADEATGERVQLSKEKGAQLICEKLEPCLAGLMDIRQALNEHPLCRYTWMVLMRYFLIWEHSKV